ncbi:MAG: chemotaxis protein CheW [Salinivirgaceae bacterium]|nr:chemotaxis protein CheW [Salinivirgaceae bacterium]MDD4746621.1 chemotaxis protein CheW [Salinivirgaceae bacterium]MDY0279685.1 chemotaxis protein CheW [Salinivirgaceae bacterium]
MKAKDQKEAENLVKDIQTYLSFRLGEETFATDVQKVLNILELKPITKVPHAPEFMRGVINLRGNVLPVIDMRVKFGMGKIETSVDTCIIVLNVAINGEEVMLGILVDAVSEVLEIDENLIEPSPSIGTRYKAEFLKGMWRNGEDSFIMLLNIDLIFSTDEVIMLQTKTEEAGEIVD